MADSAGAAVEVCDLTKRYGKVVAVDRVSFSAARGDVTAVLGPNGAGKTTTVEICEGFHHADGGSVRVLGLDPVRHAAELRARVGVMLQAGGIYPAARPRELLDMVGSCHAHPLDSGRLLEALGLSSGARTPYRRLSGGQRQRLALALALVGRPELAFLDEPTAGLDPQARHATWDVLRALSDRGGSVVFTTHYLEEAERLADHVVIIDAGRVLDAGAPAELTGSSGGTQLTFSAAAGLDVHDLAAQLPAGTTVVEDRAGHYRVTTSGDGVDPDTLATVTAWCASRGVFAEQMSTGRRTLEDVFLDLTGRQLRR